MDLFARVECPLDRSPRAFGTAVPEGDQDIAHADQLSVALGGAFAVGELIERRCHDLNREAAAACGPRSGRVHAAGTACHETGAVRQSTDVFLHPLEGRKVPAANDGYFQPASEADSPRCW